MRRNIQLWGTRLLSVVLVIVAVQHWGMPLYRQYFTPKKTEVFTPTTPVREGPFTVSFHEVGNLEAERSSPVNTETGGKIIFLVMDGKIVTAGEKLVEMDVSDTQREVRGKKLAYSNAKADVDKAYAELEILKESNKTEVEQAEAQLEFDKNELEMAKKELDKRTRLAKDKLVPQTDVDKADLEVRSSELAVLKGEKALALKKKDVQSKEQQKMADVRNVEFKATMAKLDLEEAEDDLSKGVIRAPSDGLVVITKDYTPDGRRKLKEGDSVHRRQTICLLPDLSSMLVKVQVGEADAPKVRVGLPALLRLEAIPSKIYHGIVRDISSLATEPSPWDTTSTPGRKNFEVTITVKEVDRAHIKPGMTADVEFVCDSLKNAIYVPIEAVQERNGKTYVFVKRGSRYEQTLVKTGKNNDNFVCITRGVYKGDTVALRDPTRPLEEQEAGSQAPGADDAKEKTQTAPMPVTNGSRS